ncbi:MAG: tyrosine-type recombinase/integrase [Pseudonocardiaceae bacterium]
MASTEKRTRDGKVTWLARWRDPQGRQRKASFSKKSEAARHAAAMEADSARGMYVDPGDQTTVAQEARAWMMRRAVSERTRSRLASMIRNHIEAVPLGGRRLATVRPSEVQAWAVDRGKVLGPATLRKLVSLLRSVYADAVSDRRVAVSPAAKVSLPRVSKQRVVPLTVDQVRALADAVPPRYRAMVLTQAGLGLRIGELLGLRVADVDFLRRTVRIEHQADPDSLELVPPKTPRSRRTIPLPKVVADALAAHLAAHPASAELGCACPAATDCSGAQSGLLFHTATDRPIEHDYYGGRTFPKAVKKAALPPGTSTHDLRHHFASVLLAAGESVVAVAEYLGHENATLVLTTYGHLMANSEDRMRRAVDEAYAENAASCAPCVPQESEATS